MNKQFRFTKQKVIVYEEATSRYDHPTAEMIYKNIHLKNPNISKSTVYRNLDVLSKEGLLKRIKVNGIDHFDLTLSNHYHLYCYNCHKVIDSDIPYLDNYDKQVSKDSGFIIDNHNLIFEGLCPNCQKNIKQKGDMKMESLVVYFSRAGENSVNGKIEIIEKGYTEIIAEKIAKKTNSHLFKLEPVEPYPFNYAECVKRANNEGFVDYLHPEFTINGYDVIFLGFPNWWRSYPRIVATFIKNNNWVGKTVIPFCTNEEGRFGIGESELKASVKGAILKEGFATQGSGVNDADSKIDEWLKRVL